MIRICRTYTNRTGSQNRAIDDGFVDFSKLNLDDLRGLGETVEGDLGEHMVFSLVLHATHEDKPENTGLPVVAAGDNLMIHEAGINLLRVSLFSFMIANKYEGRVEASNEFSHNKICQILPAIEEDGVVNEDIADVQVVTSSEGSGERVISPFEVQEGE